MTVLNQIEAHRDGRQDKDAEAPAEPEFSCVLALAANQVLADPEFDAYLAELASHCELIIVDGSPEGVFVAHHDRWPMARHVPVAGPTLMGKVGNVLTGVALASHERVVISDDDVRFGPELRDLVARLEDADLVRPQNYFGQLPWHAVWDSGRTLLNRFVGGDWPGTLAVRKSCLMEAGGYAGDVMFENYELAKTVEAVGGRHLTASDIFILRVPPDTDHFISQRVRQAYDELARPYRLVPFLSVLPTITYLVLRRRWTWLRRYATLGVVTVVGAAEVGRRRDGAVAYFPLRCTLAAPLWTLERALCVWLALLAYVRGGVPYRGKRIRHAALPRRERARRLAPVARAFPTVIASHGHAGPGGSMLLGCVAYAAMRRPNDQEAPSPQHGR